MKDRDSLRYVECHQLGMIVPYKPSDEYIKVMLKHSVQLAKEPSKVSKISRSY